MPRVHNHHATIVLCADAQRHVIQRLLDQQRNDRSAERERGGTRARYHRFGGTHRQRLHYVVLLQRRNLEAAHTPGEAERGALARRERTVAGGGAQTRHQLWWTRVREGRCGNACEGAMRNQTREWKGK